jgi:hypothetical protein
MKIQNKWLIYKDDMNLNIKFYSKKEAINYIKCKINELIKTFMIGNCSADWLEQKINLAEKSYKIKQEINQRGKQ